MRSVFVLSIPPVSTRRVPMSGIWGKAWCQAMIAKSLSGGRSQWDRTKKLPDLSFKISVDDVAFCESLAKKRFSPGIFQSTINLFFPPLRRPWLSELSKARHHRAAKTLSTNFRKSLSLLWCYRVSGGKGFTGPELTTQTWNWCTARQ